MISPATRVLPLTFCVLAATGLRAQFAEPFDSQASANVTIVQESDTFVTFVDYSNMVVGATAFSIPEAPRPIPGSAPTRGVLIQGNLTLGMAKGVNIIAGVTPIPFSGRYRLSFDAWINVPLPVPSGGTEQLLWGVGVDNVLPIEARHNRGSGTRGVWGWLAGENGYSLEDASINNDDFNLAQLGDTQPGQNVPFNEAFDSNAVGGPNGCAANTWVRVDIEVDATGTRVFFNGVAFFNQPVNPATGFAMIGYEDPFNSISSSPDGQWGLFDNFRVSLPSGCGTPGTAIQQGSSAAGEILIGSAPPAISAPMTLRLRGGPVNSFAFLAAGQPSPFTIPIALGPGCTLNAEILTLDGLFAVATNGDGGAQITIEIPANPTLCGAQLGSQYLWLDLLNPACVFVVTNGLTVTLGD